MCFTKLLYKVIKFKKTTLKIGKKSLNVMVADSFFKQMLGLMHRSSLKENEGMLFIFNRETKMGIWMLNMKFNIDILWINSKKLIIDFKEDAKPCNSLFSCKTMYPKESSKYVLELNSGYIKKEGINIGDKIIF
ncbi:MAG: DUF192 domain-containing protein [Candidatus Micrarchaeia archaeon]